MINLSIGKNFTWKKKGPSAILSMNSLPTVNYLQTMNSVKHIFQKSYYISIFLFIAHILHRIEGGGSKNPRLGGTPKV